MPAAPVIGAVAAAVGTAYGVYSGEKSAKQQKAAQRQAQQAADAQAQKAQEDFNRQNSKKANTNSALSQAQQGTGGIGSTMLTGSTGIQNNALNLGKNSLLGG